MPWFRNECVTRRARLAPLPGKSPLNNDSSSKH